MPISYTPNSEWEAPVITGGTPATPVRMNNIEDGLAAVVDAYNDLEAGDTTIGAATPTDGDVLTFDTGTGKWGAAAPTGGGGGGATDLDDLTDVDVSTVAPTDGQALVFDTADGLWKPATITGGGSGATDLEGLSDVDLTTPADRHVLRFDGGTSLWKNEALAVDIAELDATGTPSPTTYLRGDGSWAAAAGGSGFARATASHVTASLADNALEKSTVDMAASFDMFEITADRACRVRLYRTTTQRDADETRPTGTLPTDTGPDHGCFLEVIFDAADTFTIADGARGFLSSGIAVPITVTNLSGSASTVTVDILFLPKE